MHYHLSQAVECAPFPLGRRGDRLDQARIGIRFVPLICFSESLSHNGVFISSGLYYFVIEPERLVWSIALDVRCEQMSVDVNRLVFNNALCEEIHFGLICEISQLKSSADDQQRVDIGAPIVASQASQGGFPCRVIESGSNLGTVGEIIHRQFFQVLNF